MGCLSAIQQGFVPVVIGREDGGFYCFGIGIVGDASTGLRRSTFAVGRSMKIRRKVIKTPAMMKKRRGLHLAVRLGEVEPSVDTSELIHSE